MTTQGKTGNRYTKAQRDAKVEAICNLLKEEKKDMTIERACEIAEIAPRTFYNWIDNFPEVAEKVQFSRDYCKNVAHCTIRKMLEDENEQAGIHTDTTDRKYKIEASTTKWWLEHRDPDFKEAADGAATRQAPLTPEQYEKMQKKIDVVE